MRKPAFRAFCVFTALLAGCATPVAQVSTVDEAQVSRVETAATRMGAKIYWYSKPQKSSTAAN